MRELKFRAWDNKKCEMLSWEDIRALDMSNIYPFLYMISQENYEVMQHTGLKDKNGKDIYERDIVVEPYFSNVNPNDRNDDDYIDDTPRNYVICYDSKQAKYKSVPFSTYLINAGNGGWTGYDVRYEKLTVIGNIHENLDLLGKGE